MFIIVGSVYRVDSDRAGNFWVQFKAKPWALPMQHSPVNLHAWIISLLLHQWQLAVAMAALPSINNCQKPSDEDHPDLW